MPAGEPPIGSWPPGTRLHDGRQGALVRRGRLACQPPIGAHKAARLLDALPLARKDRLVLAGQGDSLQVLWLLLPCLLGCLLWRLLLLGRLTLAATLPSLCRRHRCASLAAA